MVGLAWRGCARERGTRRCCGLVPTLIEDGGPVWDAAEAYEQYMGRWSAAVAHALLDEVSLPRGVAVWTSVAGSAA